MSHLRSPRSVSMGLALASALAAFGCASGNMPGPDGSLPRRDGAVGDAALPPCETNADCNDGDSCTGVEACVEGRCAPGTTVVCDDSVPCTVDTCDPADGSCSSAPDDSLCSADLVCDTVEGCIPPRPCLTDEDCDDGNMCTGVETCDPAFGCRRGDAPSCDDGIPCTSDSCDATGADGAGACVHANDSAACSDGLVCNGDETCDPASSGADATGCVAGTPPDCDDGVDCTADACDEGAGGCASTPDATSCQDGVFCNGAEVCDLELGCVSGAAPDCADSIGCTVGRCDASSDRCVQDADDAFCQDGLVCNGAEQCDASGTTPGRGCVAGVPVDCGDGLACTTDICNEPTGECTYGGSDADSDGYVAEGCADGRDCNDRSGAINPGATELCDGVDNDCSGTPDDGSGMECALGSGATSCTTGCGTSGVRSCNSACTFTSCVAGTETCNDCDDNGNGLIDDGLLCRRGTSSGCTTSCGTSGTRVCASDCNGYGACAAATETCNGCDDDGNGTADDGLACRRGSTQACTTSCGTAGTQACSLDCTGFGACRASSETCNGCDDDGNGSIDDGFTCRQGATISCTTTCGQPGIRTCASDCTGFSACIATEVCNGCDDDADGSIDEGFLCAPGATQACTTSCGTAGTQACGSTCTFGGCSAAEACNGCDDDGDGSADEDFACRQGATQACTTGCGTAGIRTCNSTCGGFGACVAIESCNGCDDDGDGSADEDFTCRQGASSSCTTSCGTTGTQTCNATCGGFSSCSATEICNGCDDDGNGTADNGFACRLGSTQGCTTACGNAGSQSCNGSCTGFGTCTSSSEVCAAGSTQSCTTACGNVGTRTCNGSCTGYGTCTSGSEVCAAGSTQSCTTACGNVGTRTCNGSCTGYGTCTSGAEVCAAGTTRACTNACGVAGTQSCNGACTGYGTCVAASEVCGNSCDDNGNGLTNEGCATGPTNDLCGSATSYSIGSTVSGTTEGAGSDYTASCGASSASGDLAYVFSSSGNITTQTTLRVDTTSHDGTLHVHSSSACSSSDELWCNDDLGSTRISQVAAVYPSGSVYFVVDGYSTTNTGTFTISSSTTTVNADTCTSGPSAGVVTLSGNGTYTGSTAGLAGNYMHSSTCSLNTTSSPDAVFALTARASSTITVSTCGSSYDTMLYLGTACGGNTVACNDDSCGLQSSISFAATAGTTYYIVVDGYNGASGSYTLNVSGW